MSGLYEYDPETKQYRRRLTTASAETAVSEEVAPGKPVVEEAPPPAPEKRVRKPSIRPDRPHPRSRAAVQRHWQRVTWTFIILLGVACIGLTVYMVKGGALDRAKQNPNSDEERVRILRLLERNR